MKNREYFKKLKSDHRFTEDQLEQLRLALIEYSLSVEEVKQFAKPNITAEEMKRKCEELLRKKRMSRRIPDILVRTECKQEESDFDF